jgi:hypothetical protein
LVAVDFAAALVAVFVAALVAVLRAGALAVVALVPVDFAAAVRFVAGAFAAAAVVPVAVAARLTAVPARAEVVLFFAGAVLAVDLLAGAVRLAAPRPVLAVVPRRVVVVCAATERFAVPAFAVPADLAAVVLADADPAAVDLAALAVVDFAVVDLAAVDFAPTLLVVVLVAVPAARLAAGLALVASVVTAIVSSPLSETSASWLTSDVPVHAGVSLRLLPLPAGVLRIPSLVTFAYPIERMLGFVPRVVRTEPIRRAADIVA